MRRNIPCQLKIVLRLEICGAGIVLGLGNRQTMLDPHQHTRNKDWKGLLDLQRIIRRRLRNALPLESGGATIVLGLGNHRSMLHPHWHTRNKHWDNLLDVLRNIRRRGRNELGLGNRRPWIIVLSLGILLGRRCVLGLPLSILDNCTTIRYNYCNTPLTLS